VGQVLYTPTRRAPFTVNEIDTEGVVLLLGKKEARTRLSWDCLEGVPGFIAERGGTVEIGGRYDTAGNRGTLDEHLKGCVKRATAGWVAVLLEEAGVVEVVRERPAKVRLARRDAVLTPATAKAGVPQPTVWATIRYAGSWYRDAEQTKMPGRDARRREILFSVCCAESYIYEWVVEVISPEYHRITDYFPEDDRRGVRDRWREVPKQLHQEGLTTGTPNLGGPHGKDWVRLIDLRDGLVHAKASRSMGNRVPEGLAPFPSPSDLDALDPGWAAGVVAERISLLHGALGTDPPDWLSTP
jgi:hypothetical protein